MADSRDMIGAHDAFRREFGALAALVRAVAPRDVQRAAVVADHVALLAGVLHGHHSSEDEFVWPKLSERCPGDLSDIVGAMEAQHRAIDVALSEVVARAWRWGATADADERDVLAECADRLATRLNEHLRTEEDHVLPLIDRHLTDREWKRAVAASAVKVPIVRRPVVLGMMLHGADDDMVTAMSEAIPRVLWLIFKPLAGRAYRRYAQRVHAGAAVLR